MSTERNEIWREVRSLRGKHNYFLMPAAGAGIGFSITQMDNLVAGPVNILFLAALILWTFSFWCGHRFLMREEGVLFANYFYLQDLSGPLGQTFGYTEMNHIFKQAMTPAAKAVERWRRCHPRQACCSSG